MKLKLYSFVVGLCGCLLLAVYPCNGQVSGYVPVGRGDLIAQSHEVIYNNPVRDELQLRIHLGYETNLRIEILSIIGKVVYHQELTAISGTYSITIPVSSFEKGMYILKISDARKQYVVKKLMKY